MNHQYRIFHNFVGLETPLSASRNKSRIKNVKQLISVTFNTSNSKE